jgi:UDP-glucose 4-epimerase
MSKENYFESIQSSPTAWAGHADLAIKLVEEFKPSTIVDLGVDFGFSTFCFAYPNIGDVYGVDWFIDNNESEYRDTYNQVLEKYEELKKEHSISKIEFIKSDFNELAKTWDKQIDMLHIDGLHTFEAVKNDFETWKKFTHEKSIILFHDIECFPNDVGKFFSSLTGYRFKIKGSCGLGIYTEDVEVATKIKNIINKNRKKVLITGVAGLLGSRLADWIIENVPEVDVIGIDDLSGGYKENVNENVTFLQQNLVTTELDLLFEENSFDYVFHFAAYAAEGLSPFIRQYNYENNLIATTRIVNQCIKHHITRLVFTSTLAVYGYGEGGIFDEKQQPAPIDPYGVAKYGCEMDIQIAGEQHGLDWCIIRPHNVYGRNQNIWDKYRNVLGIWMYQYLNGLPMTIFGDGKQTRAFSCIDDIVEPLWKSAILPEASKEIINLGGVEEWTINDACKLLQTIIDDGKIEYKEGRHEVKHAIPTWQKSIDILGFKHTTKLEDGLRDMWEWAKTQPNREQFIWESYELNNGIYSFWKN